MPNLSDFFPPKQNDPNEIQFLFDLNGAKNLETGDKKTVSRFEFYSKILETIAKEINKMQKTNHKVYFISFDDKGLKFCIKDQNVIEYTEIYNSLLKEALQNLPK